MARLTEEVRTDEKVCCICGKRFYGYGNNPEPEKSDGYCCDECNSKYVIPARLNLFDMFEKGNKS